MSKSFEELKKFKSFLERYNYLKLTGMIGEETFGLLCYADIEEFSGTLDSEIEKVVMLEELPDNWTYPLIQPKLIAKVVECKL